MKIIKSSVNEKIQCHCGCEFIYNFLDIREEYEDGKKRRGSEYYDDDEYNKIVLQLKEKVIPNQPNQFVNCPECNNKFIIDRK